MKITWGLLLAYGTVTTAASANTEQPPHVGAHAVRETPSPTADQPVRAWTRPSWGFVSPHMKYSGATAPIKVVLGKNMAHSLLFDQKTDVASFRPIPAALLPQTQVAVAKPEPTLPEVVAAKIVAAQKVAILEHTVVGRRMQMFTAPSPITDVPVLAKMQAAEKSAQKEEQTLAANNREEHLVPVAKSMEWPDVAAAADPTAQLTQSIANNVPYASWINVANSDAKAPAAPAKTATTTHSASGSLAATGPNASWKGVVPPTPVKPDGGSETAKNGSGTQTHQSAVSTGDKAPSPKLGITSKGAAIVVVDDESLNTGEVKYVKNAEIIWIGYGSDMRGKTNDKGEGFTPVENTVSARFIVNAEGYIPAVGYAVQGVRSVVTLVNEQRMPAVIKSLEVVPDPDHVMVFGKILNNKNVPVPNVNVESTIREPFKTFYSIGSLDLFHPKAQVSGTSGDFFMSGAERALQYIMPSQMGLSHDSKNPEVKDWPADIVDFAGMGPVVSTTVQEAKAITVRTDVQDAFTYERPDGPTLRGTVGGQRGVIVPDENGHVQMRDLYARSSVDLIEMKADRYMTTWLSTTASAKNMPEHLWLFTHQELAEVFADVPEALDRSLGIVFGNLDVDQYAKPVTVQVMNSEGKAEANAHVYYFNAEKRVNSHQDRTHSGNQNFCVTGLEPGEYHLIVSDAETGNPLAVQVVRAAFETVSQVQF